MSIQRLTLALAALAFVAVGPLCAQEYGPQSRQEAAKQLAIVKSGADLRDKSEACRKLAVIGGPEVVADLAAMLGDEKLSHMIRYALEPNPSPSVDDAFRGALGKLKGRQLAGVINSIGVRGDVKAVDALTGLLKDSDPDVACAAAGSLGRIASPEAGAALATARSTVTTEPLRAAVIDGSLDLAGQWVRSGKTADAVTIYEQMRGDQWPRRARVGALVGLLAAKPDATALVVETIASKDPVLRGTAIARVPSLKGDGVSARLAELLPKLPADSQTLLIAALADRGDQAAMPAIVKAASSSSADVRLTAIRALGKVGDVKCVELLCQAVAAGEGADAQAAAASLRLLQDDGVNPAILRAMKTAAPAPRAVLIAVLADRKAEGLTPVLMTGARDKDAGVQIAAIKALGRLATPAELPAIVDILAAAGNDAVRAEAQRTVVLVSRRVSDKSAQADAVLAKLKAAKSDQTKIVLLAAAGEIGGSKAFHDVQAALGDKAEGVKDAAIRALAAWPDAQAIDVLLTLADNADTKVHRVLALRGAVGLLASADRPAKQKLEIYKSLLAKADRADDKKLILAGLGGLDTPAALKVVEGMLGDPGVKGEAELAMVNIAGRIEGSAPKAAAAAARKLIAGTRSNRIRRQAQGILKRVAEPQK